MSRLPVLCCRSKVYTACSPKKEVAASKRNAEELQRVKPASLPSATHRPQVGQSLFCFLKRRVRKVDAHYSHACVHHLEQCTQEDGLDLPVDLVEKHWAKQTGFHTLFWAESNSNIIRADREIGVQQSGFR